MKTAGRDTDHSVMPEPVRRASRAVAALVAVPSMLFINASTVVADPGEPAGGRSAVEESPIAPAAEESTGPTATTSGSVAYDVWYDRWGQSVADVPDGADPWGTWDLTGVLEAPVDSADQYAMRMRTLLTPVESGSYRFAVSGDDDARLFLNPIGDDPIGARQIAYVAGWTTYRQFDRYASQRSEWFDLEAGRPYYVEVIGKEGSLGDHFSVAWEQRDGFGLTIVPAEVLETTQLGSGGWRTATPSGLPSAPSPMTDPGWRSVEGVETLTVSWNAVPGAEWYEVRLEGSGEARVVIVDEPAVHFDGLVPDTRYLVEVAPANPAARMPTAATVRVTLAGPYPTPVDPVPGDRQSVSYDRWDTGWWTLSSVPFGAIPAASGTLNFGFETPPMQGDNHAARLRAVLTPAKTGDYTFFLSADDDARLFLDPDGVSARDASQIAYVAGWTEQYQWDRYQSQRSATFRLHQGRDYYIEAISVHALGLDHLEVGWSRNGGPIQVIPNAVLSPTESGGGGWRTDPGSLPKPPGTPIVQAEGGAHEVIAGWSAPVVDEHHDAATFYEVTIRGDRVEARELVTETTVTFDGLSTDARFDVTVTAWNTGGPGAPVTVGARTSDADDDDDDAGDGPGTTPLSGEYAVLATGTADVCQGIEMSGSTLSVAGDLRSNGTVGLYVAALSMTGTLSYGSAVLPGSRIGSTAVHEPAPIGSDLPAELEELLAGNVPPGIDVHRHSRHVMLGSNPVKGIHLVEGDVTVSGSRIDLDGVTIVATGVISVSGAKMVASPAAPGLPSLATTSDSCGRAAIHLSGSSSLSFGPVIAPNGLIRLSGDDITARGPIIAAAVRLAGSSIALGQGAASLLPVVPVAVTAPSSPSVEVRARPDSGTTPPDTSGPAAEDRVTDATPASTAWYCPREFPGPGTVCHR
jgi:hypothetical protein